MKRREFLKSSMALSTLAGTGALALPAVAADSAAAPAREYYELRVYRLQNAAQGAPLDQYLQSVLLPGLNQSGVRPIGIFSEKADKDGPARYVLIPYASLESFAAATAQFNAALPNQKAVPDYLQSAKASPGFDRINSWLMLAFAGMPKLELPAYCRDRKPRMFELRTYESHNEIKALKKVEMFNSGEIDVMHEVGLGPIFYGQALIGPALPHLTYMTSATSEEEHKKHWDAFGKHPVWNKLKNDPQYADTVSKITQRFLLPTSYSQI